MEIHTKIAALAAQLGAILTNKSFVITTAESCTGGGISYALTDTPGSSAYIDRCFVTYSNEAKHELLGVSQQTLVEYGAVSEQTVIEMAAGARIAGNADVAISVSGIAGPSGGSQDKPVGTVWFAVDIQENTHTFIQVFPGSRAEVRLQAIEFILEKIISLIKQ
ncbi:MULTISPECIES: CinA family protein [Pseudoalteromonas]|uniref:Nicotinamide-nucleotide amidohydrolase family protein n=1 Tax=Pseudoalteromonas obscura TaxID=3048491 RepID=A0ABT7EIR3_9GAMM|nr:MULTISPECIES: nicotinamide-nucleotide amidohydrolase family protein [Pseudoalteromonas]MBQ4838406.1 CinA family protein [Pseudoalteromonas luteoviolacea]MDK2594902.1 nicotinamide-nucleotide amidohydrolase family protein [Pseudoalteromonas sp. P94(2023)]